MKSFNGDLAFACGEIDDIPNSAVINPSNGINYQLIAVALLGITCFLWLLAIAVK